jgi:peptide/nickel transport system permease protein
MTEGSFEPVDGYVRQAGTWRRLRDVSVSARDFLASDLSLLAGVTLCVVVVAFISFGPQFFQHDPQATSGGVLESPSAMHLFGTDSIGRDVAARLVLGARSSIFVAVAATFATLILGTLIGVTSAYLGGAVDWVLMRVVDVLLSIPPLLTAIAVLAAIGPSIPTLLSVLVITYTPQTVRLIRSAALQVCQRGFIDSARISGVTATRMMLVHIIPNVRGVLIVQATITVAHMLLVETVLSFLGMGVQPPTPSLGFMVAEGRQWMELAPWVVIAPGSVIIFVVVAFTVLGQGLDSALASRN